MGSKEGMILGTEQTGIAIIHFPYTSKYSSKAPPFAGLLLRNSSRLFKACESVFNAWTSRRCGSVCKYQV